MTSRIGIKFPTPYVWRSNSPPPGRLKRSNARGMPGGDVEASISTVHNCDANDDVCREDSGLISDKSHLPVRQLRFGDTGDSGDQSYHTLGKLKCFGNV